MSLQDVGVLNEVANHDWATHDKMLVADLVERVTTWHGATGGLTPELVAKALRRLAFILRADWPGGGDRLGVVDRLTNDEIDALRAATFKEPA